MFAEPFALVWRSLVVYETTKHWRWKEGIINHFKLAVANTKGKRALAIIERAARVRIARRQTSRTAPADRYRMGGTSRTAPADRYRMGGMPEQGRPGPPQQQFMMQPQQQQMNGMGMGGGMASSVMPLDGGVAKPDEPIVKMGEPPPSPPPSTPMPSPTRSRTRSTGTGRPANARSRRAHWWKVARSRARAACSKPLDVISRWASENLDFFSLCVMPVLYVFTLTWSFERAFKGASLADLLSQLSK